MFQERIRDHYASLTPGYRKLADFIMSRTLDAAFFTESDLARRIDVDLTTVQRFAEELGYESYQELAKEIKDHVHRLIRTSYQEHNNMEGEKSLTRSIVEVTIQNLDYFATTEAAHMTQVLELLEQARHIWIAAEFTFYAQAQFLGRNLGLIKIPATAVHPDLLLNSVVIEKMRPGDVLLSFVIANPGLDTGYLIRLAKEKGVSTISVTDSGVVLAAREADLTLTVPTSGAFGLPCFSAAVTIAHIIFEALAAKNAEQSAELFTRYHESLGKIMEMRTNTPVHEVLSPD
ncbi:MAG: MurR/RpiR family transcriptional regulator [Anaerolineales bacterium]